MGLYRRENGIWYLKKEKLGENIRISLGTKDEHTAREIYAHLLLEEVRQKCQEKQIFGFSALEYRKTKEAAPKNKAFSILYQEYMEYTAHKQVSRGTLNEKKKIGKQLAELGIKQLQDITQKRINILTQEWEKALSSSSIRKYIASFKAFLNYCIKKGYLERKAYDMMVFPAHKVKVRDYIIEDKDWQKIQAHLKMKKDADFLLYMETLYQTGCRPGELVGLKKEDIDFAEGTAVIYQSKVKAENTLFLGEGLLKRFSKMKASHLFRGAEEGKEYYGKKFSKLKKHLGLPDKYILYTFRHTFATKLIQKTGDIHLVSRLLGHSDIKITAKHYINRNTGDIRNILNKK